METALYEIIDGKAKSFDFKQLRKDPSSGNMVRLPRVIAKKWSDEDLALWGAYRPVDERVEPDPKTFDVVDEEIVVEENPTRVVKRYVLEPVVLTKKHINDERERRISAGMSIKLPGIKKFNIQTRSKDRENIAGLSQMAALRLSRVLPSDDITFRDADDIDRVLNPTQIIQMGALLAARIDAIYKASWVLKDGEIKPDYEDDKYWP